MSAFVSALDDFNDSLLPGESPASEQIQALREAGISVGSFGPDGWPKWFMRLNVFYWAHRLVQASITGTSGGQVMSESMGGCGGRIDLCAPLEEVFELAELKFLASPGLLDAVRSSAQAQLTRNLAYAVEQFGAAVYSGYNSPWPMQPVEPIKVGALSISWLNQGAGLFTYSMSGDMPATYVEWVKVKQEADLWALEEQLANQSSGFDINIPGLGPTPYGPQVLVGTAIAGGVIIGALGDALRGQGA